VWVKGDLLPGLYDEWVNFCRDLVGAVYHHKMSLLTERVESAQRWEDLLYWSEHWISFGKVPELAFRGSMIAHTAEATVWN
jgi:hypothetical protein